MSAFLDELSSSLDPSAILQAQDEIAPFVTDWRGIRKGSADAVVRPRTTAEVAHVIKLARQHGIAVLPQGGNTGLTYATVDTERHPKVILSLSRMAAIRSVDRVGMTMEVEAGCVLQTAKEAAIGVGRSLPISLAAEGSAQIGGIIATNAGGVNVLRYGMARQMVLGLEAVLADGSIVSGLRALRKDNAGYDWKQLLIGSEGTLGVITAAILRLSPRPKFSETAMISIETPHKALELLSLVQDELGDAVTAFELIPAFGLELVARHFSLKPPVSQSPWVVLLEAQASIGSLRDAIELALASACEQGIATDGVLAESVQQVQQLWALREHLTEAEQKEGASIKHDVSVPISAVPDFLAAAEGAVRAKVGDARFNAFGHLGDGNIHFNVLTSAEASMVNDIVHRIVIEMGGSVSAEHGIGRYRLDALKQMRSPEEMRLMQALKGAFDGRNMMNPGAVLDRSAKQD